MKRAALGLIALATAGLAASANAEPKLYTAKITADQSIARNSTPLETRKNAMGSAVVLFDAETGDLQFTIQFAGLIGEDITLGMPDPNNPDGRAVMGGGARLFHFHDGSPKVNGDIPVNVVANDLMDGKNGVADGVSVFPNPIQRATSGTLAGRLNVKDLAARNMGTLLAGVLVDGTGPSAADPDCMRCGFNQAMATNNVYVNIHTNNNLFGEARGQVIPASCTIRESDAIDAVLTDFDAQVAALGERATALKTSLQGIRDALGRSDPATARGSLADAQGALIDPAVTGQLSTTERDLLLCTASSLSLLIPLPGSMPG